MNDILDIMEFSYAPLSGTHQLWLTESFQAFAAQLVDRSVITVPAVCPSATPPVHESFINTRNPKQFPSLSFFLIVFGIFNKNFSNPLSSSTFAFFSWNQSYIRWARRKRRGNKKVNLRQQLYC